METYNRICVEDYAVTDREGTVAEVQRGKEYLTSATGPDGTVTVFSRYWFPVPVSKFGGEQRFT